MDSKDINSLSKDLEDLKVTVQSKKSAAILNKAVSVKNEPSVDPNKSKPSTSNAKLNTRQTVTTNSSMPEALILPTPSQDSIETKSKAVLTTKQPIRNVKTHSKTQGLDLSSLYIDPIPSTSKAVPKKRTYARTVTAHSPFQEHVSRLQNKPVLNAIEMMKILNTHSSTQETDLDQLSVYLDPVPSISKASVNAKKHNKTSSNNKPVDIDEHLKKLRAEARSLDLSNLYLDPIAAEIITESLALSLSIIEPIIDVEPYTRLSNESFLSNLSALGVRPDLLWPFLEPTPSPNIIELSKRVPIHDVSLHTSTRRRPLDLTWPFQQPLPTNKTVSSTIQLVDKLACLSHGGAAQSSTKEVISESPIEYSYDCQAPMIYYKWPKQRSNAPSIFIHEPLALSDHVYAILAKDIKFYKPLIRQYYTKIVCYSIKDYNLMIEYLNSYDIPYHTYTFQFRKFVKFMMKGFPPDIDCSKLKKALLDACIPVRRLRKTKLIQGRSRNVIVEVTTAQQSKKLLWVKSIFGHKVTFEELTFPNQCRMCLRWDHSELTCRGELKCVWCGGKHYWKLCTFDISAFRVKCANCFGNHTADSVECRFCPLSEEYKSLEITCEEIKVFESNALELVTLENCHQLYGNLNYELNYANVPK